MEEQGAGAEEPDAGGNRHCSYPRPTSWNPQERSRRVPLSLSFVVSLVVSLVRVVSFWDRPGRRAKGRLQRAATARTADRKRTVHNLAMISIGRMRVMNKQTKLVILSDLSMAAAF